MAIGQIYHNIVDPGNRELISSGEDIYTDIVKGKEFTKLGIQAPPGTQVVLNLSKNIMIGRTGMYELSDNISITNMYFIKPKNYVLDTEATNNAKLEGANGIAEAELKRANDISAIPFEQGTDNYLAEYNRIQATYEGEYNTALNTYNQGLAGIYKLDEQTPEQDLMGVIIDYIQKD